MPLPALIPQLVAPARTTPTSIPLDKIVVVLKVAIVGSGPAGYYVAEGLVSRCGADVEIDVLDQLPTPYGLVRAGVAPDHQTIKAVTRRFEKLHTSKQARYFGNVRVGTDLSVLEMRGLYDAVVLAVGAPQDRSLGIAGETLPGVFGSARFVGWYNAHPDCAALSPCLNGTAAIVIGNGNVAIDVARVLTKTPQEMAHSDLAPYAAARIHASNLREVDIVGRRGPLQVGFTPKELSELGELAAVVATAEADQMPSPEESQSADPAFQRVIDLLRQFAVPRVHDKPKRIHFRFFARPVAILGDACVRAVRFERTAMRDGSSAGTGELVDLPCSLVVSCIGYRCASLPGVPFDEERGIFRNVDGLIESGLYCAGWARRGPSGTIGTNRLDGFSVAARIASTMPAADKPGRRGLEALLATRRVRATTFEGWQRIDAAEISAAPAGAPRKKMTSIAQMLEIASSSIQA